jgi:hypothetical protein
MLLLRWLLWKVNFCRFIFTIPVRTNLIDTIWLSCPLSIFEFNWNLSKWERIWFRIVIVNNYKLKIANYYVKRVYKL